MVSVVGLRVLTSCEVTDPDLGEFPLVVGGAVVGDHGGPVGGEVVAVATSGRLVFRELTRECAMPGLLPDRLDPGCN